MARALPGFLALLFLFGAAVQVNDPDPLRWMAIYLAAAGGCLLAAMGRLRWRFPAAVALAAFLWAASLAPRVVPAFPARGLFGAWEMADARVEEARELAGLLIIGACMAVLAWRRRPKALPGRPL